jgi:predicted SnoaL-like aldol condensation-catalyzing enzyme
VPLLIRAIALFALLAFTAAPVRAADTATMEANKKVVVDFYEKGLNAKNFEEAAKYLAPSYKQHNPMLADGATGIQGLINFFKEKFPQGHGTIKRVFADGDFVILHVHYQREPNTPGRAIIDLYKLENGKIVEHWDVAQDVPEKAANQNGMF